MFGVYHEAQLAPVTGPAHARYDGHVADDLVAIDRDQPVIPVACHPARDQIGIGDVLFENVRSSSGMRPKKAMRASKSVGLIVGVR